MTELTSIKLDTKAATLIGKPPEFQESHFFDAYLESGGGKEWLAIRGTPGIIYLEDLEGIDAAEDFQINPRWTLTNLEGLLAEVDRIKEPGAREARLLRQKHPKVPEQIFWGIVRYIEFGARPGSFLRAALANNQGEAMNRADPEALENLGHIVMMIMQEVPSMARGSEEKIDDWITQAQEQRDDEQ